MKNLVLLMGLIVVAAVLNAGCLDSDDDDDRIGVIVTILPQKEFVERVGGDRVKVTVMVPPGQSPHTYEPTPGQMKDIARAGLYFKVGSGVEFETVWMDTLKEQNSNMEIVDGHEGITLIPMCGGHDNGTMDPHIWLSPKNAKIMVANLLEGLKKADQDNADNYTKNANDYIANLSKLHNETKSGLEPRQGKKFLVYHPAFGYLAHDYGLIQIAIEDEGKEPTAEGIQAIIDQAKEENITVIFVSPQFDRDNAETIADEIGGTVISINPLAENYVESMREVTTELINAFSKE